MSIVFDPRAYRSRQGQLAGKHPRHGIDLGRRRRHRHDPHQGRLLLDSTNGAFTEPVVIAAPGGREGDDLTALAHRAARTPGQKFITGLPAIRKGAAEGVCSDQARLTLKVKFFGAHKGGAPRDGAPLCGSGIAGPHPLSSVLCPAQPPESAGWLHEIKQDGHRLAAIPDGRGELRLLSRTGCTSLFCTAGSTLCTHL